MDDKVLFAKRSFVNSTSLLVDKHSLGDKNIKRQLEKLAFDMLCLVDGVSETPCHVFLTIGAYPDQLVSGNLHHAFKLYSEKSTAEIRKKDYVRLESPATENEKAVG